MLADTTWTVISTPGEGIETIYAETPGRIWYYDRWRGVYKYENQQLESIDNNLLRSFSFAKKNGNTIWFATNSGLAKTTDSGKTFSVLNSTNSGLPSNNIVSLDFDSLGNMWIGTEKGLVKYDSHTWTVYNSLNSPLPADNITSLVVDNTGNVWLGVNQPTSLVKFDGLNWEIFNGDNSGLPDSFVGVISWHTINGEINDLAVDSLNRIWIATESGIAVYDRNGEHIPVELVSFTASAKENSILLQWSTATETNNHGFEIQRKFNNEEWLTVGFVKGKGNSLEQSDYSFNDSHPLSGKNYYRLKQIDYDGSFKYSNEAEVNVTGNLSFYLSQNYPNPFNPTTNFQFRVPEGGLVTLKLYDILGKEAAVILNEVKEPGIYTVKFDASDFSSGIYFYRIQAGKYTGTKKIMILK